MKMGSLLGLYAFKGRNCDFRQDYKCYIHDNMHFTWDYMVLEKN